MKNATSNRVGIKVRSGVKAGGLHAGNHNRRLSGLKIQTGIKAGVGIFQKNHNTRLF